MKHNNVINKDMNKEHNLQTEIELGVLPELISNGKAFAALMLVQENEHKQYVGKYRRMLYEKMSETLGVYAMRQNVSYKNWFMDPEKCVNDALLKNERRNPHRWHMIVNAMYHSLTDTLMIAMAETQQTLSFYQERNEILSEAINLYLKTNKKAA